MSKAKKPTPAQLEALQFMAKQSDPQCRPSGYYHARHELIVRRDVWERCHDSGWLAYEGVHFFGQSTITDLGREALGGAK